MEGKESLYYTFRDSRGLEMSINAKDGLTWFNRDWHGEVKCYMKAEVVSCYIPSIDIVERRDQIELSREYGAWIKHVAAPETLTEWVLARGKPEWQVKVLIERAKLEGNRDLITTLKEIDMALSDAEIAKKTLNELLNVSRKNRIKKIPKPKDEPEGDGELVTCKPFKPELPPTDRIEIPLTVFPRPRPIPKG